MPPELPRVLLPASSRSVPAALYIHWPFCARKCPYCDFNSHVRTAVDQALWRRALLQEIDSYQRAFPALHIRSVFFGGGTPSLMPAATVAAIIEQVTAGWRAAGDMEVTLEANPSSVEAARFEGYRSAGVNRLSLGIQSLRQEALSFLGRLHSVEEARQALSLAARIFDRFSFDLIYARPQQSLASWQAELAEALALGARHMSLYQLTLEPGTVFTRQAALGRLNLPDEEATADLFEATGEQMAAAGLPAYETSNHALPGEESRHNLAYWQGDFYLGIGPGAHGRLPGRTPLDCYASAAIKRPEDWLAAVQQHGHALLHCQPLTAQERFEERLMMGLRLRRGVALTPLAAASGYTVRQGVDSAALDTLVADGFLHLSRTHLSATRQGWPLIGALTARLLTNRDQADDPAPDGPAPAADQRTEPAVRSGETARPAGQPQ